MSKFIFFTCISTVFCLSSLAKAEGIRGFAYENNSVYGSPIILNGMMNNRIFYDWEDELTTVISTPRSGVHSFEYSIAYLSGHAFLTSGFLNNRACFQYDSSKKPIAQYHGFRESMNRNVDKLIVLVRSPRDSILRNYGPEKKEFLQVMNRLEEDAKKRALGELLPVQNLLHQLRIYDEWNPEKRLLIYYEELIGHPEKLFTQVMEFLGENNWPISEYLSHLDDHKIISKQCYKSRWYGQMFSNGSVLFPYSKELSVEQLEELDCRIRLTDPEIYDKYCQGK